MVTVVVKQRSKPGLVQRYFRHEPTLLERSAKKQSSPLPKSETHLPQGLLRSDIANFPDLSEIEVVRHFTRLSMHNFSVDEGMYPLGSCTMKYNPKIHEAVAGLGGFKDLHPSQPESSIQGALAVLYELQRSLCGITGMDDVTLQCAAGAQGEFVGLKMVDAFHKSRGEKRTKVLIPDSAHGTNPASSSLCGLKVVPLASNDDGILTAKTVARHMDSSVAALMITIPNTLGIFEKEIAGIAEVIHSRGGMIYCDGANLNALLGRVHFKKMGIDVMHMNMHKTFSTPHGGGGPGAGPVACVANLAPFLPTPYVAKRAGIYTLLERGECSIGRVKPFFGSFAVLLRAYAYILAHGAEGLRAVSGAAVINANYLRQELQDYYDLPFASATLHEVVFSDKKQRKNNVTTMDIAKRLMDFGFHPPTVYFPLIVKGALMVEPTETVSRQELDQFVAAMRAIAEEAEQQPQVVRSAPHQLGGERFDEVRAARRPVLTWDAHWLNDEA